MSLKKESLAIQTKKIILAADGSLLSKENSSLVKKNILSDMKGNVMKLDALRSGGLDKNPIDINLAQYAKQAYGFSPSDNGSPDSFYEALGINPSLHTIDSLFNFADDINEGFRWLVPEVIREAVRLGLRRGPIYTDLIAADETVSQPKVTMPKIDKSNATPKKLGEAETISMGTISFGQRDVKLDKVGVGINITDEVTQYVSLSTLSIYLQDVGVNLGLALDTEAINVLVNGDQIDGSMSAPVIGVDTTSAFNYVDFLNPWFRMGRLGRMPSKIISREAEAIDIVQIAEFKALAGKATLQSINISTPIPTTQDLRIHGGIPANHFMLLHNEAALMKLTSQALKVESERIASKQMSGTYVTTTVGFTNILRDARILINNAVLFLGNGFPSYMDVDAAESLNINK
jgi:hypothetical protein